MNKYKYGHEEQLKDKIMEYADKACPYPGKEKEWHDTIYSSMDGMNEKQLVQILVEWGEDAKRA